MTNDPDLEFQRHAFDRLLRGASSNVDSAPVVQHGKKASLTPRVFHSLTTDKTIDYRLSQRLEGLRKLLTEDEE